MKYCQKFIVVTSTIIFSLIKFCWSDGLIYKTADLSKGRSLSQPSDILKRTADFIEKYDYKAEVHMVTTEDNYILNLHRITGKLSDTGGLKNFGKNKNKPAILIQHGIGGRSDNWILNGLKSLPFLLSNSGYDVWLGDTRGNNYSKKHVSLTSSDQKYWNFSFHEQGCFDLAAMTDYIIKSTGQKKIFYVGHSRGTTMALVLLSVRPEYNEKFHLLNLFAPVAYIKNAESPVLKTFFNKDYAGEMMRYSKVISSITLPGINNKTLLLRQTLCGNKSPTRAVCVKIFFLVVGFDYDLLNQTMLPVYLTHFPDGGSLKEYIHYIQIAISDKFRQYDYGKEDNMKIYGKPEPPEYNIENITAPIYLTYSTNDYIVNLNDLKRLESRLKSVVGKLKVKYDKFNHLDFLWGTKADSLLYEPTINLFNSYL